MMPSSTSTKNRWRFLAVAALSAGCTSSMATSRMGSAVVTESNGVPCFSIPVNDETRQGLPLRGIAVTEIQTGDWNTLPAELWHFTAADPASRLQLRPTACVRYGEAPTASIQRTFKPLMPYRVYYVMVNARTDDSSMIAYVAKFCVKPAAAGKNIVQTISPDERGGDQRYELCARP
ncbi:hypothetical protein [Massilia sp. TSP1-1-2]|uniref:hypothetical protein n=2 Tax=unclassified Massilia TaxID=2609279 RepID=UPI003CF254C2